MLLLNGNSKHRSNWILAAQTRRVKALYDVLLTLTSISNDITKATIVWYTQEKIIEQKGNLNMRYCSEITQLYFTVLHGKIILKLTRNHVVFGWYIWWLLFIES